METTNTTYTNATALAAAIELAKADGNAELTAKLEKMHATATKPRAKSTAPTKAQRENRAKADEVAALLTAGMDPISTDWVREHVALYPNTPQKATSILTILVKDGIIARGDKVNGKLTYTVNL